MRCFPVVLLSLAVVGCSDDGNVSGGSGGGSACAPGQPVNPDGSCQHGSLPELPCPPGQAENASAGSGCCPAGEVGSVDGSCRAAGVVASTCADGFVGSVDGCEPILPADRCASGTMALPGDTSCRPVAPCGSGTWGDIPVEANTQYVDLNYAGGNSDGSAAAPWTSIKLGVDAAAQDAIVAVAKGTYAESVVIHKPVRLWGRCPEHVTIATSSFPTVAFGEGSDGSELHSMAVTGPEMPIYADSAHGMLIDRVWVHDGDTGIALLRGVGATSATVSHSLIENVSNRGILVQSAEVVIEDTVVRDVSADAGGQNGDAIVLLDDQQGGPPADGTIRRVVVERSRGSGIHVQAYHAAIEASVVRGGLPAGEGGHGISIVSDPYEANRGDASVRFSLVEDAQDVGVIVGGSDLQLQGTAIRGTLPGTAPDLGRGLAVQNHAPANASARAEVSDCVIERNHAAGVFVSSAELVLAGSVVRDTAPHATGGGGHGISLQSGAGVRATGSVLSSVIEGNHHNGIFVSGADITIDATIVRDTRVTDQVDAARGLAVQAHTETGERSSANVRASVVDRSQEIGILVVDSSLSLATSLVRNTEANAAGLFGDGIAVASNHSGGAVEVWASIVDTGARAAIANFGAVLALESTFLQCHQLSLTAQQYQGFPYSFDNRGNNGCGCPYPDMACKLQTAELEAPAPLGLPSE